MEDSKQKILLLKKIKGYFIKDYYNYKIFFCTYAKNIGFFFIHFFSKKKLNFFTSIKIILKDIFYSSYYKDMKIHMPKKMINKYSSIIVTWGFKKNFLKNGSFQDQILMSNSSEIKNNLWFVIYMDSNLPKKFQNNIVILTPFIKKKINIIFFIKNIFINLFCYKFISIVYNLQLFSSFAIFADNANKLFIRFLNKDLNLIFMPYEGQPFQNLFYLSAKKFSKKIKTAGYSHSPPESFPVQSIKKNGSPEILIANGNDQVFCHKKYLGWNDTKIINLPSIRFKTHNNKIKNKIFLPYTISNQKDVLKNLKYLSSEKFIDIKKFKVQAHPLTKNSSDIKQFMKKIKKISQNKINFRNSNLSIFIGASGAVAEYLERGIEAIHIGDNPSTDFYTSKLYPNLRVKKIKQNIYKYSLVKKGNLLKLGNSGINLKTYIRRIKNER